MHHSTSLKYSGHSSFCFLIGIDSVFCRFLFEVEVEGDSPLMLTFFFEVLGAMQVSSFVFIQLCR